MPKSDGWFRPGSSGNPGGRPKSHGDINAHARAYADRAIFSLARQAIEHGASQRDRRQACKLLLRIGFGPGTNIGDGILRQLGWEHVRNQLALEAQRDVLDNGTSSPFWGVTRRVPLAGKVGG